MGPPQKGGNRHPNPRGGKGRICLRPGGQDPGVPQAPASRFVSLERWTGRTDDRRSGRDQQTDSRGGGKEKPERRQTKRQTNKELDRQRDRRPGTGRQARGSWLRGVSGWTHEDGSGCLSVRQSGSLLDGVSQDLWGAVLTGSGTPSPTVCGPSSPFGLGPSS